MEPIINFKSSTLFPSGSGSGPLYAEAQVDFTQPGWRLELLRQYGLFSDSFLNNFHHIFRPVTLSSPFVTPDGAPVQHWIENHRPHQVYMREAHLYENCFVPWVKDLKVNYAGDAGLAENMKLGENNTEEMGSFERLVMVTVVDPAIAVRHHLDDEQLTRFQLEYWAQTTYITGRRIAPMRKKRVFSKINLSMQSYEEYQRALNSQGNYATPQNKAISVDDESGMDFNSSVQHDDMDTEG